MSYPSGNHAPTQVPPANNSSSLPQEPIIHKLPVELMLLVVEFAEDCRPSLLTRMGLVSRHFRAIALCAGLYRALCVSADARGPYGDVGRELEGHKSGMDIPPSKGPEDVERLNRCMPHRKRPPHIRLLDSLSREILRRPSRYKRIDVDEVGKDATADGRGHNIDEVFMDARITAMDREVMDRFYQTLCGSDSLRRSVRQIVFHGSKLGNGVLEVSPNTLHKILHLDLPDLHTVSLDNVCVMYEEPNYHADPDKPTRLTTLRILKLIHKRLAPTHVDSTFVSRLLHPFDELENLIISSACLLPWPINSITRHAPLRVSRLVLQDPGVYRDEVLVHLQSESNVDASRLQSLSVPNLINDNDVVQQLLKKSITLQTLGVVVRHPSKRRFAKYWDTAMPDEFIALGTGGIRQHALDVSVLRNLTQLNLDTRFCLQDPRKELAIALEILNSAASTPVRRIHLDVKAALDNTWWEDLDAKWEETWPQTMKWAESLEWERLDLSLQSNFHCLEYLRVNFDRGGLRACRDPKGIQEMMKGKLRSQKARTLLRFHMGAA